MKTIGFLNVLDAELTGKYTNAFNFFGNVLGLEDAPKIVSVCGGYKKISGLRKSGDWDAVADEAVKEAMRLKNAGADFLVIAGSTFTRVVRKVEDYVGRPVLDVAAPVIEEIKDAGKSSALLIGTLALMQDPFVVDRFEKDGINLIVPNEEDRGDLEKIRLACAAGQEYAFADFFKITTKYNAPYSIIACSKFDFILGTNPWLLQKKHIQTDSTAYASSVNFHARAAVKMAAGISK